MCLALNEALVHYIWCESKKVSIGSIPTSKYEDINRLSICIFFPSR